MGNICRRKQDKQQAKKGKKIAKIDGRCVYGEREIRTFKLTMLKEKRDIIQQAIEKCKKECRKDGQDITDSRALELICGDYLSS